MALYLGQLLGTENAATLAVFQVLRRSSSQREAIMEAGKIVLDATDQELLTAVLNVHKAVESERNALGHGHFGISNNVPDGILWMNSPDYVAIRIFQSGQKTPTWNKEARLNLLSRVWVYKKHDLATIFINIKEIGDIWFNLETYTSLSVNDPLRAELYRQLCDRSLLRQEFDKHRRKTIPPIPP
jgi:hypothetical protein